MTVHWTIYFWLAFLVAFATCTKAEDDIRDEKLISTFQVVRFPNDNCVGSNSRNGTCYTSQECSSKGGTSAGSCADGFGVCCTFVVNTCGGSSSENLTVWDAPSTVPSGACTLDIMPVSDDICSLRLDFTIFVITGPSTWSLPQLKRQMGTPVIDYETANYGNVGNAMTTNCHTDAFYTRGPSPSTNPPLVCGTLTGEHMYLEADSDRGNKLWFVFADHGTDDTTQVTMTRGVATLATRDWDITISQIECTSPTLPPAGCTKYYWANSGRAYLFNYGYKAAVAAANVHLGQQHERMCIRRERGMCTGCFAADAAIAFGLTSPGETAEQDQHNTAAGGCCGYWTIDAVTIAITAAGQATQGIATDEGAQIGWDCIIIPGAFQPTSNAAGAGIAAPAAGVLQMSVGSATIAITPQGPQICGQGGFIGPGVAILSGGIPIDVAEGTVSTEGLNANWSVCTRDVPFTLEFMSDDLEGLGFLLNTDTEYGNDATQSNNQGFNLHHTQLACL